MVMDTLGLAISVGLNTAVRHSQRASFLLPLAVLPVCGLGDLATIYAELKSTHLRSLNRERAELLAEAWLARRQVLSAQEVGALRVLPSGFPTGCSGGGGAGAAQSAQGPGAWAAGPALGLGGSRGTRRVGRACSRACACNNMRPAGGQEPVRIS